MLNGSAVTVALPVFNAFLNDSGTALASNAPMPLRFGTWGYGLGMNPSVFVPKKLGADYDLPEEIASWKNIRDHVNLITNTRAFTDTNSNLCHYTGWVINRTGHVAQKHQRYPGRNHRRHRGQRDRRHHPFSLAHRNRGRRPGQHLQLPERDDAQPAGVVATAVLHPTVWPDVQRPECGNVHAGPPGHGAQRACCRA